MTFMDEGAALLGAGRFHEALKQFEQALREQPAAAEPRIGLSQAMQGIGDGWAAAAWLSDACRVAPQRVDLWLGLASLLASQSRDAEMEPLLALAVALHPGHVPLLNAQAELHLRHSRFAQAATSYEKLLALQPGDAVALMHLGYSFEHLGQVAPAIARYREALACRPDFLEAHVNLAGVLWRAEDFEGALAHAKRAVELDSDHPYAVRMLGTALLNLGRLGEAEALFRRALQLKPEFSLAEIDLAFCLLSAGRMQEGFAMYGLRWRDTARMKRPGFFAPQLEWKGPRAQPLPGKCIVVYAEQGLGDVIQFIRYLPILQAQGASVACIVQPPLATLVEASMPGVQCIRSAARVQTDYIAALMDLPAHLGTTLQTIPAHIPYLFAPADKIQEWRDRLAPWQSQLRVGIAWAGSPDHVNDSNRSMGPADIAALLEVEGVQFFSLQKELRLQTGFDEARLIDLTAQWDDFNDSAAMVRHLDLVIGVDTAAVHLAGAIGVPAWVMLPPNPDWRWLAGRDDSPWYPAMRLFRRAIGESRSMQVGRVRGALVAFARESKP